jgi:hypothetical protein
MPEQSEVAATSNAASLEVQRPRCLSIAQKGVRTANDFACLMSALISDIIEEKISPKVSNAMCNAAGKLLKVVDMQMRYGNKEPDASKELVLVKDQVSAQIQ